VPVGDPDLDLRRQASRLLRCNPFPAFTAGEQLGDRSESASLIAGGGEHVTSHGLRQIAEYNPVSSLAVATRTLFGNPTALPTNAPWTLAHPVASSLAWCAALLAIAVPLTVRRFRAKTMD
jgi:hypothetical protein